jgi:hypothetical protein
MTKHLLAMWEWSKPVLAIYVIAALAGAAIMLIVGYMFL